MQTNEVEILSNIMEIDKQLAFWNNREKEINTTLDNLFSRLKKAKQEFEENKKLEEIATSEQEIAEKKLKQEEEAVIARRKQLEADSSSGASLAKAIKRDIDISTKVIKSLEESLIEKMEKAQKLRESLEKNRCSVEEIEKEVENFKKEQESSIGEISEKINEYKIELNGKTTTLAPNIRFLYERLRKRYVIGAIAKVVDGACEGCHRELPPQIFNTLLKGGTLIQCPSCSRILIIL